MVQPLNGSYVRHTHVPQLFDSASECGDSSTLDLCNSQRMRQIIVWRMDFDGQEKGTAFYTFLAWHPTIVYSKLLMLFADGQSVSAELTPLPSFCVLCVAALYTAIARRRK